MTRHLSKSFLKMLISKTLSSPKCYMYGIVPNSLGYFMYDTPKVRFRRIIMLPIKCWTAKIELYVINVIVEDWHITINLYFSPYSIFTCLHVSLNVSIQIDVFKKVTRKCFFSIYINTLFDWFNSYREISQKKKKTQFFPFYVDDLK